MFFSKQYLDAIGPFSYASSRTCTCFVHVYVYSHYTYEYTISHTNIHAHIQGTQFALQVNWVDYKHCQSYLKGLGL